MNRLDRSETDVSIALREARGLEIVLGRAVSVSKPLSSLNAISGLIPASELSGF